MIEKYLTGDVKRKHIEERMINLSLKETYDKQLIKRDSLETIKE